MHRRSAPGIRAVRDQDLDPARQDAPGRSAPAGVEQGRDPGLGIDQVDGNAIRDRDREEQSRRPGGVPVEAIENAPAIPARGVPRHVGAMALDGEYLGVKIGQRPPEIAPALHDLPDRLRGPEAEIEARDAFAPSRDPRHERRIARPRLGELEPGNGPGKFGFSHERSRQSHPTRWMSAPSARRRVSIFS